MRGLASETSFGVPSGHSQISAGFREMVADYMHKAWVWILAVLLVALIGLSRLYLGVHFPHDVLVGWTLGFLTLWAFVKFWDPVARRVKKMAFWNQVGLAFTVSLGMILIGALIVFLSRNWIMPSEWIANATRNGGAAPDPMSLSGLIAAAGTLFGLCIGLAWVTPRGRILQPVQVGKRALRFIVGPGRSSHPIYRFKVPFFQMGIRWFPISSAISVIPCSASQYTRRRDLDI